MTSINDVADLPKRLEEWAAGKGYLGAFGIDAERAMTEDLRKLLSLTVQQAKAMEDSQERTYALEQRLPTSQTDVWSRSLRPTTRSRRPPVLTARPAGTRSLLGPPSSRRSWPPTLVACRSPS